MDHQQYAEEYMRHAVEARQLAEAATTPKIRDEFLRVASEWQKLAAAIAEYKSGTP